MPQESGDFIAGDMVKILKDVVIEGQIAFQRGESVLIERIQPYPQMPAYKYVVHSQRLDKDLVLSGEHLWRPMTGTTALKHQGSGPADTRNEAGAWFGNLLSGFWSFDKLYAQTLVTFFWRVWFVVSIVLFVFTELFLAYGVIKVSPVFLIAMLLIPIEFLVLIIVGRILTEAFIALFKIERSTRELNIRSSVQDKGY